MASLKKILCLSPARCLTTIRAISTQGTIRFAEKKDELTHTGQVLKKVCFDYVNGLVSDDPLSGFYRFCVSEETKSSDKKDYIEPD